MKYLMLILYSIIEFDIVDFSDAVDFLMKTYFIKFMYSVINTFHFVKHDETLYKIIYANLSFK